MEKKDKHSFVSTVFVDHVCGNRRLLQKAKVSTRRFFFYSGPVYAGRQEVLPVVEACVSAWHSMVQAGAVGRRRAACLATSPFVDSLLFRVLSISVNCDCLLRVINWGTCVHFVYPCAPRRGPIEAAVGPIEAAAGPWHCVSFSWASHPNHVINVLRDAGCPPWGDVAYEPAVGLVAESLAPEKQKLKPAWHRWHARVGKRLWLALNL